MRESSGETAAEGVLPVVTRRGTDGPDHAIANSSGRDPEISPDPWIIRAEVLYQQNKVIPVRVVSVSDVEPVIFGARSEDVPDDGVNWSNCLSRGHRRSAWLFHTDRYTWA
jgi:hypothetical protein